MNVNSKKELEERLLRAEIALLVAVIEIAAALYAADDDHVLRLGIDARLKELQERKERLKRPLLDAIIKMLKEKK